MAKDIGVDKEVTYSRSTEILEADEKCDRLEKNGTRYASRQVMPAMIKAVFDNLLHSALNNMRT